MNRSVQTGAILVALVLSLGVLGPRPAAAGGFLEQIDLTNPTPSPIPGQVTVQLVRIHWDERTIPVQYRVNELDPIPNPLGAPVITQTQATGAFSDAMESWNDIRTSYVEMEIAGTVASAQPAGFDFVNELTFRTAAGFNAIAVSPSTSLTADANFTAGLDIDGDGDADVASGIAIATDVDADGDVEFPEGFYPAGTILDNDVSFNAAGLRFTVDAAAADTNTSSVDLEAIAVHELGHSHGLSHVLIDQISRHDGDGSTMFPFIDTGDPAAELGQRGLHEDDIATSSLFYPEGTATSGPAALQHGDLPFGLIYATITGEVTDGATGLPVAGASVYADGYLTGTRYVGAYSGTTQLSYDPATGGLFLVDPSYNILDGRYTIPVRTGLYSVQMEAVDGNPVPASSVNFNAIIGNAFGQQVFNEEAWNAGGEGALESSPGYAAPVGALAGFEISDIDLVTNVESELAPFGSLDFVGFTGSNPGDVYAVRIPGGDVQAALASLEDGILHGIKYRTTVFDASVVPIFAEAALATGSVSADGTTATIDLQHPLRRDRSFVAQPNDFSPFWFVAPESLTRSVERRIDRGKIEDLFLVLTFPETQPFPGPSGVPPVVGLDGGVTANDAPLFGLSYLSSDGGATFSQVSNFNFMFSLVLSEGQ